MEWTHQKKETAEPGECHRNPLADLNVQIVRHFAALYDQARPRNCPMDSICTDNRPKRPPLQMRALQRLIQKDAIAGAPQAIAQLDVLNRWPGEAALVEAAHVLEGRSPDRAAPRPKG